MALLPARDLLQRLKNGERFIADGAMGTNLLASDIPGKRVLAANLERPELVREIHKTYLHAGARIITANTFGIPAGDEFINAVCAGVEIADSAAKESSNAIGVWASFPPQTIVAERETLRRMTDELPDALLIETCVSLREALQAIEVVKELSPALLAVTCHFRADGTMPDGASPKDAALALRNAGADIVGANCGDTPESFLEIAERMRNVTDAPLLMQPSAGLPQLNECGEWVYLCGPEEWAAIGRRLFEAGVNIVGGCCGTTPAHIAALYNAVRQP